MKVTVLMNGRYVVRVVGVGRVRDLYGELARRIRANNK